MSSKIKYETRLNGRGGWEVGLVGDPAGMGEGNYPTETAAFTTACYNYDRAEIKRGTDKPAAKPQPSIAGRRVRRVKALTK